MSARDPKPLAPPSKGAPPAQFPVDVPRSTNALAPIPINDRFPLVVGQALSLTYLSSVFRLSTTGYRQQLVDLLNELLEQDPHLFSVVTKRIFSGAVGRVETVAVQLPEKHPEYDAAQELAAYVQSELDRIPDFVTFMSALLWAIYYGLSAEEIFWTKDDGWHIERLGFIHSRRLAYPSYQDWSLYVWDQGQVYGWSAGWGDSPTNSNMYGLRIADWPGKFIVHTPQLRGDYPTRDGIGRQVATWACFKRVGARAAVDYLERFSKSFMDVSTHTSNDQDPGKPREATTEDKLLAAQIAATIGVGSGSYAVHPDSIEINPKSFDGGGTSKLTWPEWIQICDGQMSKAALGGTLGTEVGKGGGNRSLGEVQERGEVDLEKYDVKILAETIRRDIVSWLVRLNRPTQVHLTPHVRIHIDPDPDPKSILALAKEMADLGAPVDLDQTADAIGVHLVPNDTDKPRQSISTLLANVIKALTACDFPVDIDEMSRRMGIPIVAADALETARRSRVVTGGKDMPVEPDGSDDPNDPNYEPLAAPTDGGDGDAAPKPAKAGAKKGDKAGAKATPGKPGKTAKPAKAKLSDVNAALRGALMLSDRSDRKVAVDVFDQLLEDYPRESLGWILAAHWNGPEEIPVDELDFASEAKWRASHEDITPYVERIAAGKRKPVIVVKTPGNPKYVIVDGHHRTLASRKLDLPVLAYVAHMHVDSGPWDELHAAQKKGSSKGSYSSYLPGESSSK